MRAWLRSRPELNQTLSPSASWSSLAGHQVASATGPPASSQIAAGRLVGDWRLLKSSRSWSARTVPPVRRPTAFTCNRTSVRQPDTPLVQRGGGGEQEGQVHGDEGGVRGRVAGGGGEPGLAIEGEYPPLSSIDRWG